MQQELHLLRERISLYQKKQEEYAESLRAVYMDRARGLLPEREAGELAKEFLDHFCKINAIKFGDLPVLEGALKK